MNGEKSESSFWQRLRKGFTSSSTSEGKFRFDDSYIEKKGEALVKNVSATEYPYTYRLLKRIMVGDERQKFVSEVYQGDQLVGTFFIKETIIEEAVRQRLKWEFFAEERPDANGRKANVPDVLEPIVFENRTGAILVEYLNVGENFYICSPNNPEIDTPEYHACLEAVNPECYQKMIEDMYYLCELASKAYKPRHSKVPIKGYLLQPNAFMIRLNKENPNDSQMDLGDFGADVEEIRDDFWSNEKVFLENLKAAASAFYILTKRYFAFPEGDPRATWNEWLLAEQVKE